MRQGEERKDVFKLAIAKLDWGKLRIYPFLASTFMLGPEGPRHLRWVTVSYYEAYEINKDKRSS